MKKLILFIFAFIFCFYSEAQTVVQGHIFDSKNNLLPGATVRFENTFTASVSNENGSFRIETRSSNPEVLLISYIGFETIRIENVSGTDNQLTIMMKPARIQAGEVVITGIRANENSPFPSNKISGEQLAENNMGQDIPILLDHLPSLVTTSDAGSGVGYTGIRLRGSDATRINVTINGIPLNDSESQGVYWVDLPDLAASVEDIQIQRGVGTSTNGAGAFGGSVNVITSDIKPEPYGEYSGSLGSFNTIRNSLGFGTGLLKNNLAFAGRMSKINSDGYIDRASSNLRSMYLTGAWYGNKNTLRFHILTGKEITYQAWNGVHQDSLKTNRTFNSAGMFFNEDGSISFYDNEVDNYQQDHYQLTFTRKLTEKLNLSAGLHYTYGRGYYEQFKEDQELNAYGIANLIIDSTTIYTTDLIRRKWLSNDFYGLIYSLDYKPNNKTTLILGGAFSNYEGDHYGEVIWARYAGNSNIRNKYYSDDASKKDINIYLKLTRDFTANLNGFIDLQYRDLVYDFTGLDQAIIPVKKSIPSSFFNPKAGVSYRIKKTHQAYAYFGIANKEPSREDYVLSSINSQPKSEKLSDLEIGMRGKLKQLNYTLNYYNMSYKDQLVLTGKINDVGEYTRQNVDRSSRQGFELELVYPISKKVETSLNLTSGTSKINTFNEFIDDYDTYQQKEIIHKNKSIAFSPELIANANIMWYPIKNLKLTVNSKYVGSQYLDNTENNFRKIEDYMILNGRINCTIKLKSKQSIDIIGSINNITNLMYSSNGYTFSYHYNGEKVTENYFYPQAGINGALGLALKF